MNWLRANLSFFSIKKRKKTHGEISIDNLLQETCGVSEISKWVPIPVVTSGSHGIFTLQETSTYRDPTKREVRKINFKVDFKSRYVKSSEEGISRRSLEPSSIHFGTPIFVGWTP